MKTTYNPHVSKQANGDESVKKIIEINFWLTTLSLRKHLLRQKALYLYFVSLFLLLFT
jgi:hypothetical protein